MTKQERDLKAAERLVVKVGRMLIMAGRENQVDAYLDAALESDYMNCLKVSRSYMKIL